MTSRLLDRRRHGSDAGIRPQAPWIALPVSSPSSSFSDGPSREQHPFTISSGSHSDLRFSIKASGDFTKALLAGVPVGSAARIEGPYGAFDYRRGRPHQLWLAGGIGITPFLSMAEDLDAETDVLLVWSVRDEREAIYLERALSSLRREGESQPGRAFNLRPRPRGRERVGIRPRSRMTARSSSAGHCPCGRRLFGNFGRWA